MKNKIIIFLSFFLIFLTFTTNVFAHPGRTAADGCHYCRTNCDSWGVPWNERHCHGGGSSTTDDSGSSGTPPSTNTAPQPVYVAPTSTPIPQAKTIEVLRKLIKERKEKKQLWSDAILSHIRNKAVTKTATKTITPLFISSGANVLIQPITKPQTQTTPQQQTSAQGFYQVAEVVDGDTIRVIVDGKVEPVRLLAIDTPETKDPRKAVQCFGQAASNKMNELVSGKSVRLERDTTQPDRDKYKRLLRYVYLQDGTDAGAQMIKQGYAFAYTRFPSDKLDEYRGYEKQARETNQGLWGSCQIQENGSSKNTNPVN